VFAWPDVFVAARRRAPRARVLARVATPQTTGELAAALGLSAAASAHVTALRRAGVADRARGGRRVFYGLGARGRGVLAAFEGDG
jgi:DNA-binding transcriptional ArsR family regulator